MADWISLHDSLILQNLVENTFDEIFFFLSRQIYRDHYYERV